MAKILGYGRTSTGHQEMSPEVQKQTIEAWINYQTVSGQLVDAEYLGFLLDDAVSSSVSLLERPKGQFIPVMLERGDVLVVAKHDRAFRSGSDAERTLEAMALAGVRVVLLNLNIDTSTHDGIMMATIFGACSRWERENIRKRTQECMALKKLRGEPMGQTPIGWKASGPKHNKQWYPDIQQRKLGEFFLLKLLEGYTLVSIQKIYIADPGFFGYNPVRPIKTHTIKALAAYAAHGWPRMTKEEMQEKWGTYVFSIVKIIEHWEMRNAQPATK